MAEDKDSAVLDLLLRRVSDRWAEYDADALTATESQALRLLVAAGMVERRGRFRMQLHNHPVAVEATITATGEYGFVEAMRPLLASMWTDWKDAFHAWQTGEARQAPPVLCEHLQPDEWRLTEQGVLARADVDAGKGQTVVDFVLCRGFFDGQPRLDPDTGRISQRLPVHGSGHLVTMRRVQTDSADPAAVNIVNWQEGAEAFAQALVATINMQQPISKTTAPPDGGPPSDGIERRVSEYLDAHQDNLDKMADAYQENNMDLGEELYKREFSPIAMAKVLNCKHRGSVQRTRAYRTRVQRYRNVQHRNPDDVAADIRGRASK